MGKIRQGILGGFSGKVGTVVGGSWKGINYMRSRAASVANPRTEGQMRQRTKFALALSVLKPITVFLRTGYKLHANKQTAFNAAMSYTLANVIAGEYPDFEIDYSKLLVSRGTLASPSGASATVDEGNVKLDWVDNSGSGEAFESDKALVAIINTDQLEAVTDIAGNTRTEIAQEVPLPAGWVGDNVEVYLGFISDDGKRVSNSVYLGSFVVA